MNATQAIAITIENKEKEIFTRNIIKAIVYFINDDNASYNKQINEENSVFKKIDSYFMNPHSNANYNSIANNTFTNFAAIPLDSHDEKIMEFLSKDILNEVKEECSKIRNRLDRMEQDIKAIGSHSKSFEENHAQLIASISAGEVIEDIVEISFYGKGDLTNKLSPYFATVNNTEIKVKKNEENMYKELFTGPFPLIMAQIFKTYFKGVSKTKMEEKSFLTELAKYSKIKNTLTAGQIRVAQARFSEEKKKNDLSKEYIGELLDSYCKEILGKYRNLPLLIENMETIKSIIITNHNSSERSINEIEFIDINTKEEAGKIK